MAATQKMSWQRPNRNTCGFCQEKAETSVALDELRNIIEVRKWQVNQAAGRYIRSHEAVQHISIRDRLNDFMQQHGTVLAAALAPELMGYSELTVIARNCAIQRATDALREALLSWLAKGEKN